MTTKKPWESRFARLHPREYLGLYGALGLLTAAACAWLFSYLADEVPEKGTMARVDQTVANWLQTHGTERGEAVFSRISGLGLGVLAGLLMIVGLFFLARRDWRRVTVLAVACAGGALLNLALKASIHRARPSYSAEFHATWWSFPSGHAMNSLIGYGLLAYWLGARFRRARVPLAFATTTLVLLIGYARLYLGVHYLSDVIAGYCAGSVWLIVCITGDEFARRRQALLASRVTLSHHQ